MHHFVTLFTVVVASVVAFSPSVQAQEKKVVNARSICFARAQELPDIYIAGLQDQYKIKLPVESFSPSFKCVLIDGKAVFYKEDGVKADGKPKLKVVAQTQVRRAMRDVLFYFIPAKPGGKHLYRVLAMEDGIRKFPLGHSCLLNLSESDVAFQLGEHIRQIPGGEYMRVAEVKKRDNYNMAPVICRMKTKDGKWVTISESRSRFTNRKRLLIVSYVDPATRQPQLRVYKDIPLAPNPIMPSE